MRLKYYLFVLLLISIPAFSQPQFSLGGKIGVGIGNVASNFSTGKEASRTGLNLGMVGAMSIGKNGNLFAVGELLFNQKGGKDYSSGSNFSSYLEVPVMGRYSFAITETIPLRVFLNAGPYFGLLLSRKVDGLSDATTTQGKSNPLEMGITGGGGIMYPTGSGNLFLEVRYSSALTSVVTQTLERNQQTTISVGYLINISGKTQEEKDKTIESGFDDKPNTEPKKDTEPVKERKRGSKKAKSEPQGKKADSGQERQVIKRRADE